MFDVRCSLDDVVLPFHESKPCACKFEDLIAEDVVVDHVPNLRRETKEWGVRSVELGAIISQLLLSEKTEGTGSLTSCRAQQSHFEAAPDADQPRCR